MEDLLLILSWAIFYSLHTLLASTKLKRILEAKWPIQMKSYRLFYSVLFLLMFYGILVQALFLPFRPLVLPTPFFTYLGYMMSALGLIIISRSLREISFTSFLGFSTTSKENFDQLIEHGIYSRLRHPLYMGFLLIFIGYFMVSATIGSLIHLFCLVIYLPMGIYFEEKKLLEKFGVAYENYQKKVPAILPLKRRKER